MGPFLLPWIWHKANWINDLDLNSNTLHLIEEKVVNGLEKIGREDNFLNRWLIEQALRSRIDKRDLKKLIIFSKAKDTVSWTNKQPSEWEKVFRYSKSSRGLLTKIIKNSRSKTPIKKKKCTYLNREFSIEKSQMGEKHLRKWSTFLSVRKTKIKSTLIFHFTPLKTSKICNTVDRSCW